MYSFLEFPLCSLASVLCWVIKQSLIYLSSFSINMFESYKSPFTIALVIARVFDFFLILTREPFFSLLLERKTEREWERERETPMWDRNSNWLPSRMCSNWGWSLQPGNVPWQGIKPRTLQSMGWCSNQLSHTGQGSYSQVLICSLLGFFKLLFRSKYIRISWILE